MKSLIRMFAALALALGSASTAFAQRTINDCEKIQAADAYNQCLAKFGPPAKTLNVESPRPGDMKSGAEAASGGGGGKGRVSGRRHGRATYARHGRGRALHATRGGRKRMTISIGR